ncbi:hypothetical protein OAK52_02430 [Chloroflexi bacterium]|nr:hypothetical protein [Chloroflexota bacterium]
MKKFITIFYLALVAILFAPSIITSNEKIQAQDIPELHMLIIQGDIILGDTSNTKSSSLDGFIMHAKIGDKIVSSTVIGEKLTGRFSGLEIGPEELLEGESITFWVGNEKSIETAIFGPLTPSGQYCPGCTWSLPISRTLNLHFRQIPLPTPTPAPASVQPSFLTGSLIFGSVLSAPEGVESIDAFVGDILVGTGEVSGSDFSITIDPGIETFLGTEVTFVIAGYESKTSYIFAENDFRTDFKLFFPQYIPPTPTATPAPLSTAVPAATSTPEPTRTPTPIPEPTPTYTPTPTPTPIVLSSLDENDVLSAESSDGGCNSRGGGPASVGLIILSLTPAYLINRSRKRKNR